MKRQAIWPITLFPFLSLWKGGRFYLAQPLGGEAMGGTVHFMAAKKNKKKSGKKSSKDYRVAGQTPPVAELPTELANLQADEAAQRSAKANETRKADGKAGRDITIEDLMKFIRGEITLAQLEGVSREKLYEFAEIGYTMFKSGKYEEAARIFEGLTAYNPYDGYFHSALGAIYQKEKRYDEAIRQYNLSLKLNPKDTCSYTNRGETYLMLGRLQEAAEDFKKAIELDPEEKDPWSMRSRALVMAVTNALQKK